MILKSLYTSYLNSKKKIHFFFSVNWIKTLYFNFKMFPYPIARQLPVYFYGKVKFSCLHGNISIEAPIKRGMIGFGQPYEMTTISMGIAEFYLAGDVKFKGYMQFGKDYLLYIAKNAYCEFGNMSSMASKGKLICTNNVKLGDFARLGSESQIIDTNFHQMINTITLERYPINAPIEIGNYNFIGNRVSIMSKTRTPNLCTIASNSVCNKDYRDLGENVMIGGMPGKLLKENICRDWSSEYDMLMKYLIIN